MFHQAIPVDLVAKTEKGKEFVVVAQNSTNKDEFYRRNGIGGPIPRCPKATQETVTPSRHYREHNSVPFADFYYIFYKTQPKINLYDR